MDLYNQGNINQEGGRVGGGGGPCLSKIMLQFYCNIKLHVQYI